MGKCLFLCAFGFAGLKLALILLNVLHSSPLGLECRLVASGNIPDMQGVLILALNLTCWTKEAAESPSTSCPQHLLLLSCIVSFTCKKLTEPAAFSEQDSNFTQSVKLTYLATLAAYAYI